MYLGTSRDVKQRWSSGSDRCDHRFELGQPLRVDQPDQLAKDRLALLTSSGTVPVALPEGAQLEYAVTRAGATYYAIAHVGPRQPWSQEVIRSDDRGRTWTVLLPSVRQPQ